jgi:25S rRNA (cytosine2870-C5)-methyltransferase
VSSSSVKCLVTYILSSDDLLRGPVQEFDFDSDDEEPIVPPSKNKKSKQSERPQKIIPTASDASSDESDAEDEEDHITMANMEARSRALDAKAALEADLEAEELQDAAMEEDEEGENMEVGMDEDGEPFQLPSAEEREAEKNRGGPDVHVVQRRMRECVRILGNFKRLAPKGRWVFVLNFLQLANSTFQITFRVY